MGELKYKFNRNRIIISDEEILELYEKYEGNIYKIARKHPVGIRRIIRVLEENGIKR